MMDDWKNIVWSEESSFLLRYSDGRIWHKQDENMDSFCFISAAEAVGDGPGSLNHGQHFLGTFWTSSYQLSII